MTTPSGKPILYHKPTCGWCQEAITFFEKHKVDLELRDISANRQYQKELIKISGQRYVPTLKHGGFIVADFGVDELLEALDNNPEEKEKLGLQ